MTNPAQRSLLRLARFACALSAVVFAAPALADFTNPGFESGAAGWTWKQFQGAANSTQCTTASLYPWTPTAFPPNGNGVAASLVAFQNLSTTPLALCAEASQIIDIPAGSAALEFSYKLGDSVSIRATHQAVQLSVVVESLTGGAPVTVFSDSGISVTQPPTGGCSNCPTWQQATVDMSSFAGSSVRVRFVSQSRESRANALGRTPGQPQSPAFLDDIHIASGSSGCVSPPSATPNEGWFVDSTKPNTAVQISPRGDSLIFGWLTFDASGSPVWYFGQPSIDQCGAYSGPIYEYHLNQYTGEITSTEVASVNLSFDAYGNGSFNYDFAGQNRTASLSFFQFGNGYGVLNLTGFYADATRANSGTYVVSQGDLHLIAHYVFDRNGYPVWAFAQGQTTGSTVNNAPATLYVGQGRCPLCTGPAGALIQIGLGEIDLLPQGGGAMLINGHDALSGGGISWPFGYTPHGQL